MAYEALVRLWRAWHATARSGQPDHLKNPETTFRPPTVISEGSPPKIVPCALDAVLQEARESDDLRA